MCVSRTFAQTENPCGNMSVSTTQEYDTYPLARQDSALDQTYHYLFQISLRSTFSGAFLRASEISWNEAATLSASVSGGAAAGPVPSLS